MRNFGWTNMLGDGHAVGGGGRLSFDLGGVYEVSLTWRCHLSARS